LSATDIIKILNKTKSNINSIYNIDDNLLNFINDIKNDNKLNMISSQSLLNNINRSKKILNEYDLIKNFDMV
jgi:predicted transcriptional regulator